MDTKLSSYNATADLLLWKEKLITQKVLALVSRWGWKLLPVGGESTEWKRAESDLAATCVSWLPVWAHNESGQAVFFRDAVTIADCTATLGSCPVIQQFFSWTVFRKTQN